MDYSKAIKSINQNAEFNIVEDDLDNIQWLNGTTPISKDDIEAKMSELPTAEEEVTSKQNKKASGKQKLKDLGLDDDEINALMGV